MKIHLDLSRHCIETALKKFHEKSVSRCLRADDDKASDRSMQTIEVTRHALENLDFSELRARCRPLGGGTDYAVMISISEKRLTIWVDDRIVETCVFRPQPDREKEA